MENYKLEPYPVKRLERAPVSPARPTNHKANASSSLDDWLVWADAEEEL